MRQLIANLNDLAKRLAEVGPRGGKIIGRTRSGKPIYEHKDHSEHNSFDRMDHLDAATLHKEKVKGLTDYSTGKPSYKSDSDRDAVKHHKQQSNAHMLHAVS